MRSCLERRSPSEIAGIARQVRLAVQRQTDPELMYSTATFLAVCGRREEAIQRLHEVIGARYCAYPSLMTDPLLASVSDHPDFSAVVRAARACRERFESYRRQHDTKTAH